MIVRRVSAAQMGQFAAFRQAATEPEVDVRVSESTALKGVAALVVAGVATNILTRVVDNWLFGDRRR